MLRARTGWKGGDWQNYYEYSNVPAGFCYLQRRDYTEGTGEKRHHCVLNQVCQITKPPGTNIAP